MRLLGKESLSSLLRGPAGGCSIESTVWIAKTRRAPPGGGRYNGLVRGFFTRRQPPFDRILLIESGNRHLFNELLPLLYRRHGGGMRADLVTCFAGVPEGFQEANSQVYRVTSYRTPDDRNRLVAELKANRYSLLIMICSAEPIMTKWKWMLAAKLPLKVMVINENGDTFWIDWQHFSVLRHFVLFRAGLTGAEAVPALSRILFFPLTLAYLALYALWAHTRRWIHLRTQS